MLKVGSDTSRGVIRCRRAGDEVLLGLLVDLETSAAAGEATKEPRRYGSALVAVVAEDLLHAAGLHVLVGVARRDMMEEHFFCVYSVLFRHGGRRWTEEREEREERDGEARRREARVGYELVHDNTQGGPLAR